MSWTKPHFGVQHLENTPRGIQVTVEEYSVIATCSIINFNLPSPWMNSRTERFPSATEAKRWGEHEARKWAA